MDNYKIVATVNGKKYTFNNVGEPAPISLDENVDKGMIRAYVAGLFLDEGQDTVKNLCEIEEIKYYQGRKIIRKYKYSKDFDPIKELLIKLKSLS